MPGTAELTLRERNKKDKRQRIRAAARELFSKRGYDDATLRGIAEGARVALGTIFNYAQDKRDLVFLIVNEELEEVTTNALEAARTRTGLLDQLMAIFACHYEYFAKDPAISRILLRELVFYSAGKQAEAFHTTRDRLIAGIEKIVRRARQNHQIRRGAKPTLIARHAFFTFSAAVRWWIAGSRPKPRTGLKELRRLLELQFRGLLPSKGG